MNDRKIKWLIYTVLVGLIPILSRFGAWLVTKNNSMIDFFSASDFIAFGLVLHISIINEVEHINFTDKTWKTIQNGVSILFIAFYSVLFTFSLFSASGNIIDINAINKCSVMLAIVSFLISYSVFDRITKLDNKIEVTA